MPAWFKNKYAMAGVLLALELAAVFAHPVTFRYCLVFQVLWLTLFTVEVIERTEPGRLRTHSWKQIAKDLLIVCGTIGGFLWWNSKPIWSGLDQAAMCYLLGFWAAAMSQAAKGSLAIRSILTIGVLAAASFYSAVVQVVWQGHSPKTWLMSTAACGAWSFLLSYGNARAQGAPRSFSDWLRLSDQK